LLGLPSQLSNLQREVKTKIFFKIFSDPKHLEGMY
jgi:hypothetical protein